MHIPHFTPAFPVLLGDIGGTNARFRTVSGADGPATDFERAKVAQFDTIEHAIRETVLAQGQTRPKTAVLAAAGPIGPKGLKLTNSHWRIEAAEFLLETGCERLILLNDFEAQALALPALGDDGLERIGDGQIPDKPRTKAVIGPGTGLGVGTLVRNGGRWIPLPGEGGHVDLGPRNAREADIWTHLERVDGRVSAEQVLSGDGLENLYHAVCTADGRDALLKDAASVSQAALAASDARAEEALHLFCTCLGRVAGDLALTTLAKGGVYIGGGIVREILPFLRESGFRAAFVDKAPHSALLGDIATFAVTHPLPALEGLEAFARDGAHYGVDVDHRDWSA